MVHSLIGSPLCDRESRGRRKSRAPIRLFKYLNRALIYAPSGRASRSLSNSTIHATLSAKTKKRQPVSELPLIYSINPCL